MIKRHPKTKEIITEMDKWAKGRGWNGQDAWYGVTDAIDPERLYTRHTYYLMDLYFDGYDNLGGDVLHFVSLGCDHGKMAYCARPGTGKVVKHRIGNCPLAKEKP